MPDKGIKPLKCSAAKAGEGWHGAGSAGPPLVPRKGTSPPKSCWEEDPGRAVPKGQVGDSPGRNVGRFQQLN